MQNTVEITLGQNRPVYTPKVKDLADLAPMARDKMLSIIATEINTLIREHDAIITEYGRVRMKIGEKLYLAREYFNEKVGINKESLKYARTRQSQIAACANFYVWCDKNIVNRKGTPYAHSTIKSYMIFYKDPETRQARMEQMRGSLQNLKERRKPAMTIVSKLATDSQRTKAFVELFNQTPMTVQEQVIPRLMKQTADHVNILMTAWDNAPEEARQHFMKLAGLKYL